MRVLLIEGGPVNVNLYLPDDLGEQAKAENLKLSRLLREAVVRELHRRSAMSETLSETQVYEVDLGNDDETYTGLITGKLVHETPIWLVFLTSDRRVIIHYGGEDTPDDHRYFVLDADASERELVDFLRMHIEVDFEFVAACRALGVRPVVEL